MYPLRSQLVFAGRFPKSVPAESETRNLSDVSIIIRWPEEALLL